MIEQFVKRGIELNQLALKLPTDEQEKLVCYALFLQRQEELKDAAEKGELTDKQQELLKKMKKVEDAMKDVFTLIEQR